MSTLLELQHLSKHFGGVVATADVGLAVTQGETHALIGPNGAGKTTLVAQIAGMIEPDSGRIVFDGQDLNGVPPHGRVRLGLARSWQVTSIFSRFTVLENLALAVQARSGSSLGCWRPVSSEKALYDEAGEYVRLVGLAGREHAPGHALAHGEQRQLEVGLALATRPKMLLLDEPMAGLGPEESERMIGLIEELRRTSGSLMTVLLVEHDMDAVFRLADRISVLVSGRIIATGAPDYIRAHPEVRRAYLGEEAA